MTSAEAVETSVTTINSLSQDFTNLDDQPSQTLTDTPGFKPFTLIWVTISGWVDVGPRSQRKGLYLNGIDGGTQTCYRVIALSEEKAKSPEDMANDAEDIWSPDLEQIFQFTIHLPSSRIRWRKDAR